MPPFMSLYAQREGRRAPRRWPRVYRLPRNWCSSRVCPRPTAARTSLPQPSRTRERKTTGEAVVGRASLVRVRARRAREGGQQLRHRAMLRCAWQAGRSSWAGRRSASSSARGMRSAAVNLCPLGGPRRPPRRHSHGGRRAPQTRRPRTWGQPLGWRLAARKRCAHRDGVCFTSMMPSWLSKRCWHGRAEARCHCVALCMCTFTPCRAHGPQQTIFA